MPPAARLPSLERAVQPAIAVAILLAVLAAGSIQSWIPAARTLRWVALVVLAMLALAWAWRRGRVRVRVATVAAPAAFVVLAALSALWSVDPFGTVARTGALALVLVAAAALASAAAARPDAVERVLDGIVAGAGLVAAGGLLVLLFRHERAIQPATANLPARYQGLGGGPNTATMLMAVALPAAAHAALEPGRALRRALGWAVALGLLGSIVASGSRGALLGAFAGLLVWAALREATPRRAALAAAVVLGLLAAAAVLVQLPDPAGPGATSQEVLPDPDPVPARAVPPYVDANLYRRLQDDLGRTRVAAGGDAGRPLTGSSGRSEAWAGALRQAADRPFVGYGFGTETRVFVDRYVGFNSGVPENSYVGLALQLGLAGLVAFGALAAVLLVPPLRGARRADSRRRRLAAACAGAFCGGLVLALFQSYVYAAGNNATLALWICAFLLAAVAAPPDASERR